MNKGLEAIEILKERKWVDIEQYKALCELIKTALIDGEIEHTLRIGLENVNYKLVREKQDNEKKLKALEIIKEKQVNVWCLLKVGLKRYNNEFVYQKERHLTQEEYDLLKKVVL